MNRTCLVALGSVALGVALGAIAEPVHDWKDLLEVHHHLDDAIGEMERAASANHYDMKGHARKAEQLLRDARTELQLAIDSARDAH